MREGLGASGELGDVFTGEHWLALQAMDKGLVDQLMTSDQYIRSLMHECDVIEVKPRKKRASIFDMIQRSAGEASLAITGMLAPFGAVAGEGTGVPHGASLKFEHPAVAARS